jgi:hypothetical protein
MPVHHLLERILDEFIVLEGLQSGPLYQSVNSAGTEVTGQALNRGGGEERVCAAPCTTRFSLSQDADCRRSPLRESPRKKDLALERDADCRKDEEVLVGRAGAGLSNGVRRMDGRRQASALHLCWDAEGKSDGEGYSGGLNRMPAPAPKPLLTREERRAKREARRAKQREENVGRAAKMHTARLVWERSARPQASPQHHRRRRCMWDARAGSTGIGEATFTLPGCRPRIGCGITPSSSQRSN